MENFKNAINEVSLGMSEKEFHQLYGEAISQIIQAYNGVRVDKYGNQITHNGRNLKEISNYKLNENMLYKEMNIKQQAGFSAELIEEARINQDLIINGADFRKRTTDGVGMINDTQYDHINIDERGNIVSRSGTQMKFLKVQKNPKTDEITYKVVDKLANDKEWKRYDTDVFIPKEDYEGAKAYANNEYKKNMKLYKKALDIGEKDIAYKYKQKAKDYKKVVQKIKPAKLTQQEAIEARLKPEKFVIKEVTSNIHKASKKQAFTSLKVSTIIATAQNLYAVVSEGKSVDEAIKDILKSSGKSIVTSYGINAASLSIKSTMHASKDLIIRKIGTTSAPTLIATGTLVVGRIFKKYANSEISGREFFEELGESSVGMITAGYCASSGTIVGGAIGSFIPIIGTAVGGLVGGLIGATLGQNVSGVIYREAMLTLKNEKLSQERREFIENVAKEVIEENNKYIDFFRELSQKILSNREGEIVSQIILMNESIIKNDINKFILSINQIGNILGCELEIQSKEEIEEFMLDDNRILKL